MQEDDHSQQEDIQHSGDNLVVVAVGASAGGLESFKKLVFSLPENAKEMYIFLQHSDPTHESFLPAILQSETRLPVRIMPDDVDLNGGVIYVVPPGMIPGVKGNRLQFTRTTPQHFPSNNIDKLFGAVAEIYQSASIGILLSGMGADGSSGLEKIKDHGGVILVQTPSSARFPDMPQNAVDTGLVDFQFLPENMGAEIALIAEKIRTDVTEPSDRGASGGDRFYQQVLNFLRLRKLVDFTHYKESTLRRRILRRMIVNHIENLEAYAGFLESNPDEPDILYNDLLIPVTGFFRDENVFAHLCEKIFPQLLRNRNTAMPIRIWIAGCSTGQEAYSMAICLHEFLGENSAGFQVQLFATDISERAIRKARNGIYLKREVEGMSDERLEQYFSKIDGVYQVKKNIRNLCLFAVHNFLNDPPFAKMDLVSCRNVLIYMDGYLQKKAMATFHYALNENGVLLLGKSETTSTASGLFSSSGDAEKTFVPQRQSGRTPAVIPGFIKKTPISSFPATSHRMPGKDSYEKNANDILIARYTPAAVIINDHFEILQFKGDTSPYLSAPQGKASFNLLKMVKGNLSFEVRAALHKARDQQEAITRAGLYIHPEKPPVTIEITPFINSDEQYFLLAFREEESMPAKGGGNSFMQNLDEEGQQYILQMEAELLQLKEDLRIVTEDQEAVNEELQSGNEELLSGNEELQSLNEELETSKEELQSTNEELMTVSQELYDRNEQYNLSRLFAESIVKTIREPLLILNKDLRIRSANPAFYQAFGLTETEAEGKILFQLQDEVWNIPELRTLLSRIQTGDLTQAECRTAFSFTGKTERVFLLKIQTVLPENSSLSILLAFEDISLRLQEADRLRQEATKVQQDLEHRVTDLVQATEKGQAHAEILEITVADRTLQLQQSNIALEHSNRNLQGFASIAAHDLQEPLRKIRTFAAMLHKQIASTSEDEPILLLNKIEKSAARMATLIKDVLNFYRLSSRVMHFETVDLQQIANNILDDFELKIEEQNAVVTIQDRLPVIEAVAPQMNQLFYNLVSNSLKFVSLTETPKLTISFEEVTGSEIHPAYDGLQPSARYARIIFSDNGIGFDPQHGEQIFSIFERLNNKYDGTGIGLALCRQIVEQHGGFISAGKGTISGSNFIVLLPYNQQQFGADTLK